MMSNPQWHASVFVLYTFLPFPEMVQDSCDRLVRSGSPVLSPKWTGVFGISGCNRLIRLCIPKFKSLSCFTVAISVSIAVNYDTAAHALQLLQHLDHLRLIRQIHFVACFQIQVNRNDRQDKGICRLCRYVPA